MAGDGSVFKMKGNCSLMGHWDIGKLGRIFAKLPSSVAIKSHHINMQMSMTRGIYTCRLNVQKIYQCGHA